MRVSRLEVLINTNVSDGGGGWLVEALEQYLTQRLWTEQGLQKVLVVESGQPERHILTVHVQEAAIEIGARQRRVHAHFILRVRHVDKLLLGRIQPALQRHVRRESMFSGAFVSVRLLNSAQENYALRETFLCIPASITD